MAAKSKARYVWLHTLPGSNYILVVLFNELTCAIRRTMIVRMISSAQTGFFYTAVRPRQGIPMSAIKYDPRGKRYRSSTLSVSRGRYC